MGWNDRYQKLNRDRYRAVFTGKVISLKNEDSIGLINHFTFNFVNEKLFIFAIWMNESLISIGENTHYTCQVEI